MAIKVLWIPSNEAIYAIELINKCRLFSINN